MQIFLLLTIFVAVGLAVPVDNTADVQVIRSESDVGVSGYKFAYETSDGVERQEEAELRNIAQDADALTVRGTVQWIAPDGITYKFTFIADENGYRPEGEHIPQSVPQPPQ